jgi:hypothetical protein
MIAMSNLPLAVVKEENTILEKTPGMIKQSFEQVKHLVQDGINVMHDGFNVGMNAIQDSMTVIKDEFLDAYDKTASCINRMMLPVNNFIKDFTQIDTEFQAELSKDATFRTPRPNIVPIEIALNGYMEENY